MRHGFPELADELRPIQGEIVEVRKQAIEIFDKWIENYKDPKYKKRGLNVEVLD